MKKNLTLIVTLLVVQVSFGQTSDWYVSEKMYIKTNQDLSFEKTLSATKLNSTAYITSQTHLLDVNNSDIIYFAPIWKSSLTGEECAIDNSLILYDVDDLETLVSSNNLSENIISIDSIAGEPTIYTLSLRNITHKQIDSLCAILMASSYCKIAEPNYVYFTSQQNDISPDPSGNTYYSEQWGLYNSIYPKFDINARDAWRISTGGNIKVAIIDSGFELTHPDLINNIYSSYDCTDGGDGALNGVYGSNADSHGTQCAGVIAATNNDVGVIGVAPDSRLILLRRGYSIASGDSTIYISYTSWIINALRTAYQSGADVISNSWSIDNPTTNNYTTYDAVLSEACTLGRNGKGCVIVFSTGNQYRSFINYPSNSPYTIAVGAMNQTGHRPTFSNYGQDLDLVAPGVDIKTTQIIPKGTYCSSSGTSFAAPMVAGVAALILSVDSTLNRVEVRDVMRSTAYQLPDYSFDSTNTYGKWNDSVGYGLVDAFWAVWKTKYQTIQGPEYICIDDTVCFYIPDFPDDATYSWTADPGFVFSGTLNIIEGQGTPTIRVWLREYNVGPGLLRDGGAPGVPAINPPYNHEAYVKVTVTLSDNTTYTIKKILHHPRGATPTIDVSSTATPWKSGTSRLYTITNNTSAPGEDLHWKITDVIFKPTGNDTTITYSTGNMLYYTPYLPPAHIGAVTVTATNTFEACEVQTDSITFGTYNPSLHAPQQVPCRVENHSYTLELWHSIYGLLRTQPAQSAEDSIDTSGLSQGLYIIILKENGQPIKQTKLLIP